MEGRQGAWRALVVFGALAAARTATAQEPKAASRLTWDAPPSCPTAEDIEARIKSRTPNPPRSVTVQVSLDSDPAAPTGQVRVTMSTDGAERSFVAPSCEEAATAVAVIVALAANKAEPPPELPPEKPTPPPPPPTPREQPQPPPPNDAWRWVVGLGGAVDTGSLPSLAPGVAIGVEARAPRTFVIGLEVAGFAPKTERVAPAEATIALVDVLPRACALLPFGAAVRGGTCLGAGVGIMPGESANVTQPRSAIGFRPEAVWLARLEATLSAWASARVEGGALVDPVRPPFRIDPWGEIYRPPLLTARLAAMVDFRFR